jgi:hypothetical protein
MCELNDFRSRSRAFQAAVVLSVVLLSTIAGRVAEACFHVGPGVEVEVGQSEQQAVIFHRDGRQDLVMRIGLETSGPIESLGWILPVPSLPDDYEVYDDRIFDELEEAVDLREKKKRGLTKGPASEGAKMEVVEHPSAAAGPYRIQPIEVDPERGVAPLQGWMEENDFEPLEASQLQYYVQRGWTFLAIRVDPQEGKEHLAEGGNLPALRASFASEHAVYPLKMSTHQGVFPVRLYLITDERPDKDDFMGASMRGFFVAGVRHGDSPVSKGGVPSIDFLTEQRLSMDPLFHQFSAALHELSPEESPPALARFMKDAGAWDRQKRYALSVLYNPHVNQKAGTAAEWPEELAIPALPLRQDDGAETPRDDGASDPPAKTEQSGCVASGPGGPRPMVTLWGVFLCGLLGMLGRVNRGRDTHRR